MDRLFQAGPNDDVSAENLVLKNLRFCSSTASSRTWGERQRKRSLGLGCLEPYLDQLQALNIKVMELSSNATAMTVDQKMNLVRKLKERGFIVFAEIGKKLIGRRAVPKGTNAGRGSDT